MTHKEILRRYAISFGKVRPQGSKQEQLPMATSQLNLDELSAVTKVENLHIEKSSRTMGILKISC